MKNYKQVTLQASNQLPLVSMYFFNQSLRAFRYTVSDCFVAHAIYKYSDLLTFGDMYKIEDKFYYVHPQ